MEAPTFHCRLGLLLRNIPVLGIGGEEVALDHGEGGNGIAEDVGAPQQWYPVVEDDGGREPEQEVRVCKPQEVCDEPRLQAINFILVDNPCAGKMQRSERLPCWKAAGLGRTCCQGLSRSGVGP